MSDAGPSKHQALPKDLQLFGEFVIDSLIDEGPTWALYKAVHIANENQRFRVRLLQGVDATRRQVIEAFARQAILLQSLRHDGIIPVAGAGVDQGLVFVINAEVPGITLKQRIESGLSALDPTETARIIREAASVLDYLHDHDPPIVHRTLDPSMILLSQPGGAVKILEVGYAHAVEEVARVEAIPFAPVAPPGFRAPEDTPGKPSSRTFDEYALAKIARVCLTARKTPANDAALAAAEPVFAKATAADPADRYPSAGAFAQALADAMATAKPRTSPSGSMTALGAPGAAPPRPTAPSHASSASIPKPASLGKGPAPAGPPRKGTILTAPALAANAARSAPALPADLRADATKPDSTGAYGAQKSAPGIISSAAKSAPLVATPSPTLPPPSAAGDAASAEPDQAAPVATQVPSAVIATPPPPRPSAIPLPRPASIAPATASPSASSLAAATHTPAAPPVLPSATESPSVSALAAATDAPSVPESSTALEDAPRQTISLVELDDFDALTATAPEPAAPPPPPPPMPSAAQPPAPPEGLHELPSAVTTAPLFAEPPPAPAPPAIAATPGPASSDILVLDEPLEAPAPAPAPAILAAEPVRAVASTPSMSDAPRIAPPVERAPTPTPATPEQPAASAINPPPAAALAQFRDEPTTVLAPPAKSSTVRVAMILGGSIVLAAIIYTGGVVLREPLMRLATGGGQTQPDHATPANQTGAGTGTTNQALPPAVHDAGMAAPIVDAGSQVAVHAATDAGAIAPPTAHDAGNPATAAVPDAGPAVIANAPPTTALPRVPSHEVQAQTQSAIEQRIATCEGHLGHHAYIRVVYDGPTGQVSTVEFTGHTLDGNPLTSCLESNVRAVSVPPFRDAHWEAHYTFMIR